MPKVSFEDKVSFEEWMEFVGVFVEDYAGVSIEDLPDQPYRDWYDEGVTIRNAARRTLKNALKG